MFVPGPWLVGTAGSVVVMFSVFGPAVEKAFPSAVNSHWACPSRFVVNRVGGAPVGVVGVLPLS